MLFVPLSDDVFCFKKSTRYCSVIIFTCTARCFWAGPFLLRICGDEYDRMEFRKPISLRIVYFLKREWAQRPKHRNPIRLWDVMDMESGTVQQMKRQPSDQKP